MERKTASGWLILNEKLTPAEQRCRSIEKHFSTPFHGLHPAGSMHAHRRANFAGVDGGHGRGARACARRHRLPYASLAKAHFDLACVLHLYKLDVHAMLEVVVGRDVLRDRLPAQLKLRNKHHVVWIPHRNRNPAHLLVSEFDGKRISHLRHTHGAAKLKVVAIT